MLHARDTSTEIDCDGDWCDFDFQQSEIFFSASGLGVWAIYVDGYRSSNYGCYSLYVSGL